MVLEAGFRTCRAYSSALPAFPLSDAVISISRRAHAEAACCAAVVCLRSSTCVSHSRPGSWRFTCCHNIHSLLKRGLCDIHEVTDVPASPHADIHVASCKGRADHNQAIVAPVQQPPQDLSGQRHTLLDAAQPCLAMMRRASVLTLASDQGSPPLWVHQPDSWTAAQPAPDEA